MDSKYVTIGDGADGKEIKEVSVHLPNCSASKFILTFHVKAVVLSDGSKLVISSY